MLNRPKAPTRPGTLAEVVRLVRRDDEELRFCLAGFLDEFYADRALASRRARIEEDPGLFGEERRDALIGAIPCPPLVHGAGAYEGFSFGRKPRRVSAAVYFHGSGTASSRPHAEGRPLVGLRNHADGSRAGTRRHRAFRSAGAFLERFPIWLNRKPIDF
jgi:hypothetical protein